MTNAILLSGETGSNLKDGLIRLSTRFRAPTSPPVTVRVDSAKGFQAVINDAYLTSLGIKLELGEPKNKNSNPIAERSISELEGEITKLQPEGGTITEVTLDLAVTNMNSRLRGSGLASAEMWTGREMNTGEQLSMKDNELISKKLSERKGNHLPSAKYKARGKTTEVLADCGVGDIVYIYNDRDKTMAREKYLVTQLNSNRKCTVQKFAGSQFRKKQYLVALSDVYKVDAADQSLSANNEMNDATVQSTDETIADMIVQPDNADDKDIPLSSKSHDEVAGNTEVNNEVTRIFRPNLQSRIFRPRRNIRPPQRYGVDHGEN